MNKAFVREPDSDEVRCPRCGAIGEGVPQGTLAHFVPPEARRSLAATAFFCPTPRCEVAYFDAFEAVVLAEALAQPIYPKDPAAPMCGCFGLTMDDVRDDAAEGYPRRIRELYARSKTDAAHCDERSPTGRCCLPEVQRQYFKLRGGA